MIRLKSFHRLQKVDVADVMKGESGAERVKKYSVPMAAGLAYHYAAKAVDDQVLEALEEAGRRSTAYREVSRLFIMAR